uniref:Uncharacterized protein n=1 Tax=Meloidogyne hapla TaxID=6305 RepID=A0A1I8C195_MELHA
MIGFTSMIWRALPDEPDRDNDQMDIDWLEKIFEMYNIRHISNELYHLDYFKKQKFSWREKKKKHIESIIRRLEYDRYDRVLSINAEQIEKMILLLPLELVEFYIREYEEEFNELKNNLDNIENNINEELNKIAKDFKERSMKLYNDFVDDMYDIEYERDSVFGPNQGLYENNFDANLIAKVEQKKQVFKTTLAGLDQEKRKEVINLTKKPYFLLEEFKNLT